MKKWGEKIHSWLKMSAGKRAGILVLFILAFADASFLPLPVTTYFLVIIVLNKEKLYKYVLFVLLGTLAGALSGYLIGDFAWVKENGEFTGLSTFIFNNIPGFTEILYNKIQFLFTKYNFWILCAAVTTPIPYGVFSVFSGAFEINILIFLITTLVCQSTKFILLATVTLNLENHVRKMATFNLKASALLNSAFITMVTFFSNTFKN